tara:strand:- start:481 stop:870 length:390 start_codon:yes stop_codon:yes gene_type:complete
MKKSKQVLGDPIIINGKKLSLSKAVKAGDYIFLTGQIPMINGKVVTEGNISYQTKIVLDQIGLTLKELGCDFKDIVKSMVWLQNKEDFRDFDEVYKQYFPIEPPARSAVLNELLVDVKVEIEVIVYDNK